MPDPTSTWQQAGLAYDVGGAGELDPSTIQPANATKPPASAPVNGAPYITGAAGLTSALSQLQAGRINSSIDNYNANLARLQASQAVQAGGLQEAQEAGRQRQREGATAASFGAQGVQGGTAATTLASSRNMSAMDQLMIETNARRQAYGFQVKAAQDQLAGTLAQVKAKTGAASTILATGAQEELEQTGYQGIRYGVNLQ